METSAPRKVAVNDFAKLYFNPRDQCWKLQLKYGDGWGNPTAISKRLTGCSPVSERYVIDELNRVMPQADLLGKYVGEEITLFEFVEKARGLGISEQRVGATIAKSTAATRPYLKLGRPLVSKTT